MINKIPKNNESGLLINLGNKAFRNKDYDKAIRYYQDAVKMHPELVAIIEVNIKLAKSRKVNNSVINREENIISVMTVGWVHNATDLMTHKYRVHNYSSELEKHGIRSIVILQDDFKDANLDNLDVVVLCRVAGNDDFNAKVKTFKSTGGIVIFDIDDLIFDPNLILNIRHIADRDDLSRRQHISAAERLKKTMLCADYATTSTFALKKEVGRFGLPTYIIPNNLPKEEIARANQLVEASQAKINLYTRIGYFSGTATHEYDFLECSDALYELMEEHENIQFMVVGKLETVRRFKKFGSRFIQLDLMPYEEMLECLATTHINLAPLEYRNRFTQGKSELKIFEAALFGIPTVASPTASYGGIVQNKINGFLAYCKEDWKRYIKQLFEDKLLRKKIGETAKDTIASRYYIPTVANEYAALLNAIRLGTVRSPSVRPYPAVNNSLPAISVVSIIYRKEREVWYFLESLRHQDFELKYEIVLVDDCCPGETAAMVRVFEQTVMPLADSNKNMTIKVIKNESNKGNCYSRNYGVINSEGEIVVIVDADCMFDNGFLSSHYLAHSGGDCDMAIGPKGIETNKAHPLSVLNIYNVDRFLAISDANPQDGLNQDSFVNCVTRNLSIKRDYIQKMEEALFDEVFSYSRDPESGFGWEDVELGCRLYENGARIKFLDQTASIHISHPPTVDNEDKPFRSLKNFRRLHEKHPYLKRISHEWSLRTFETIVNWCDKVGGNLKDNQDYQYLKQNLDTVADRPRFYLNKNKKLKILTYRWHSSHQYELYRLGHEFTLVTGLGTALTDQWDWACRPLPLNAKFMPIEKINFADYDLAILHFDENVFNPSYSFNPDKKNKMVPNDWGNAFKAALEWNLPKVAICHGTPQFYGQYNGNYSEANLGSIIEDRRLELVNALRNVTVICNSHQAQKDWGFEKSKVIWQGFAPHEYPPINNGRGLLSMNRRALENRPHYNGYFILKEIESVLAQEHPINSLVVADPPFTYTPRTNPWAKVKYENYVRALCEYSVYINPTVRSPMPRTRGEAMMAGLVTVSLRNHDVDMFIDNGVDGFYADSAAEMAEQIKYLTKNHDARLKMMKKSRETAVDIFNQHRFLSAWNNILKDVI